MWEGFKRWITSSLVWQAFRTLDNANGVLFNRVANLEKEVDSLNARVTALETMIEQQQRGRLEC